MSSGSGSEKREWMPAYVITFQVVTTLLLGVRLISRFKKLGGGLGLDDLFIGIAWTISVASMAASIYSE